MTKEKVEDADFHYISCKNSKIEIIENNKKISVSIEVETSEVESSELGQSEQEIIDFAFQVEPQLGVLVGDMGCGKSTTLGYLRKNHLPEIEVRYCDLDSNIVTSPETLETAERVLCNYLSPKINELISPIVEFRHLWTWGLAKGSPVLASAQNTLRSSLGDHWIEETDDAIKIRKECCGEIFKDPSSHLTYVALKIDYYLTVLCANNRAKFLIILDNVDPLPPKLQSEIMKSASRVQVFANCKMLIALRPLTYSSNHQTAHRTVNRIAHFGPPVLDLIKSRVERFIVATEMPDLKVRITDDNGRDEVVGQREIKLWVQEIINSLGNDKDQKKNESAGHFIEGICNNSLRSALVLAPRLFGSAVIPFSLPDEAGSPKVSARIPSYNLIRAILVGGHSHFETRPGRIVDNIFDLGATSHSLTCKIRILKNLEASDCGRVPLNSLREHLLAFGYSLEVIRDSINAVIHQAKRLAWSDAVTQYDSIDQPLASTLEITSAGRFYINHAILNLEYVQEVHVDAYLPPGASLGKNYNSNHFSDRIASLYLFVLYLHAQDRTEVLKLIANHHKSECISDYRRVYGAQLFSTLIASELTTQVLRIGRSVSQRLTQPDIEAALEDWRKLEDKLRNEDRDVLSGLELRR